MRGRCSSLRQMRAASRRPVLPQSGIEAPRPSNGGYPNLPLLALSPSDRPARPRACHVSARDAQLMRRMSP